MAKLTEMNMPKLLKTAFVMACIIALVPTTTLADTVKTQDCVGDDTESCSESSPRQPDRSPGLAGPEQVENRLHIDSNMVTPMFPSTFARGYFDWKDRIKEEHGVGSLELVVLPS